ncbi:DDE Tnp4 domain-containing protein [Plasmodiophora brassicae]|uniref:DUF8040 domain-containing protein n=1 Tax=Plasmodiophora brassicae TaxID=37360 RepID=A0A0G4INT4_PLABS|nr:hypothetical protein PBRA_005505 [Plasmodiophora brassicae]
MPDAHAVLGDHGVLPLMVAAAWYSVMYLLKTPRRTSSLSGKAWVDELLAGNHRRFREVMRMEPETFHQLKLLLLDKDLLRPSRWVSVEEKLAIFLFIAGHAASNRDAQERFQRSGWTITRCFNEVLRALVAISSDVISLPDPGRIPGEIRRNRKWYPYFKDCLGALDGTHIPCRPPKDRERPFRNRKSFVSQNVLAVCSFNLRFLYVLAGPAGFGNGQTSSSASQHGQQLQTFHHRLSSPIRSGFLPGSVNTEHRTWC